VRSEQKLKESREQLQLWEEVQAERMLVQNWRALACRRGSKEAREVILGFG
jgi:hypothetical protein